MPDADERLEFYGDPKNSIGYLTRLAFRSFSRALEKRTLPEGVSSGQWRFLRVLWNEEGLTQRELSRRVRMKEPTTVTALKSLQRSGFVDRRPSKEDRRKVHVHLTAKGRNLKKKLLPHVAEVNEIATRGVAPAELESLRRSMAVIIRNLAEESEEVFVRGRQRP